MVRPTWTTDLEASWLGERKKTFSDAQANSTTRAFLNATTEAFKAAFPRGPPTDAEIAEAGSYEKAVEAQNQKLRNQIEWWFRNRARANATGGRRGNGNTAVLSLTRRRVQSLHPYQAYMHLYSDKVMPQLKANYKAYKDALPEGEEAREWWGYAITEATRLYETESAEVKAAVNAYRELHLNSTLPGVLDLNDLMKEGLEAATKRVRTMQQNINRLARTAFEACKAIEEQTGWKASMFLGGPNPETGRLVTLTVHNGRTADLQNIFSEATEEWDSIQKEWDTFVARCYGPELAAKLEKILQGTITPADLPPVPAAEDGSSSSSQPGTSSASADTATSPPPATTPSSGSYAVPSDLLSYEQERLENVARNQEILKRVVSGETFDTIVKSLGLKTAAEDEADKDEEEAPEWIEAAKQYLEGVSSESWWSELVLAWLEFERALGYPDNQLQSNWLSPKARPEEVKYWIARGRKYDKPPNVKSLGTFLAQFRHWWARLQPSERRDPNDVWPLLKNTPDSVEKWSDIRRGGWNGLFMVVMCLSWWLLELTATDDPDEEDLADLRECVEDVKWAIVKMVPLEDFNPTTSTPAPDAPAPAPALDEPAPAPDAPAPAASANAPAASANAPAASANAPAASANAPATAAGAATPMSAVIAASTTSTPSSDVSLMSTPAPSLEPVPPTSSVVVAAAAKSPLAIAPSASTSSMPTVPTAAPAPATLPASSAASTSAPETAVPTVAGSKRAPTDPVHEDAPAAKKLQGAVDA